jgi:hypothetical protein
VLISKCPSDSSLIESYGAPFTLTKWQTNLIDNFLASTSREAVGKIPVLAEAPSFKSISGKSTVI